MLIGDRQTKLCKLNSYSPSLIQQDSEYVFLNDSTNLQNTLTVILVIDQKSQDIWSEIDRSLEYLSDNWLTFATRLEEVIKSVKQAYLENNKDFVIDISTNEVLFQIVSNSMLERKGVIIGFGIHLPFDNSIEESKVLVERFTRLEYTNQFELHLLDGITTYQLDLGVDEKQLQELVEKSIQEVYL